jgi:glycosyltransferase involved in cell wall biosynthesis
MATDVQPDSPMPASTSSLISVALSVYNGGRYLQEQLDSILAQRGVDLELVAVDDGSQDDSVAILQACARRDPRVQVHVNPANLGPTRSFERALSLCRGDYLAPSDQDDRWHPDKLASLLAALGEGDLAYGDSEYIDAEGRPGGRRISQERPMMSGHQALGFVFANSVSGHAALLRRSLFEAVRPLPPELYHDWVLAMFAAARNGVVYVDRPLVEFRRHANAFSPVGRRARASTHDRDRRWLLDRSRLLQALADSRFDADGSARRMARALAQAMAGSRRWPLLHCVWRERAALAGGQGSPALHAWRLQIRLLRKLRGARRASHAQVG